MLVLDSTTKSIVATMSGTANTTNPSFVTAYSDNTGTVFTEGSSDGALNGISSVTLVAAPASSTRRLIKTIYISNIDTAAVTVTISYNDNSTLRQIAKVTLQVGDTWSTDGTTDNTGSLKTTAGSVNLSNVTGTLTANGIVYASSTSVLTTGSALTFNGTNLGLGGTTNSYGSQTTLTLSGSNVSRIDFRSNGTFTGTILSYQSVTEGLRLQTETGYPITFYPAGTEAMRIGVATGGVGAVGIGYTSLTSVGDSGLAVLGNVGIGTNAPTTYTGSPKLAVYGNQASKHFVFVRNDSASASASSALALNAYGNTWGIEIGSAAKNGNSLTFQLDYGGTNATKMTLDTSGNLDLAVGGALFTLNRGLYSQQTKFYQDTASGAGAQYETTNPTVNANYYPHVFKGTNNAPTTLTFATINQYGIGLGNNFASSGTGITFPATQSASSNVNTLDDYEEGTWTPILVASGATFTYTASTGGTYVKIGRLVLLSGVVALASKSGGAGSSLAVSGLPFAAGAPDSNGSGQGLVFTAGIGGYTLPSGYAAPSGAVCTPNTSAAYPLLTSTLGSSAAVLNIDSLSGTGYMQFSMTYYANT